MPCPVTVGFLHSLEHDPKALSRDTSYEFVVDGSGSFPDMRASAVQELPQLPEVYDARAQYTIQVVVASMHVKVPSVASQIFSAQTKEEMLDHIVMLREEIEDLVFVSKLKRKTGGDNAVQLSDRMIIQEVLPPLEQQIRSYMAAEYREVGFAFGGAFRALRFSADYSLKTGRKLLSIKGT